MAKSIFKNDNIKDSRIASANLFILVDTLNGKWDEINKKE